MTIEGTGLPSPLLSEYAAIPMTVLVRSALTPRPQPDGTFQLTEHAVDSPYLKDYDALSEPPGEWARHFDTTTWHLIVARDDGQVVGGATVVCGGTGLDMLEGRSDLAVLWDIRVAPHAHGRGVGRALFRAAEAWACDRGCTEIKVETQNVNVAACRFYAALGCALRECRADAYPECPGEHQLLFRKFLHCSASTPG